MMRILKICFFILLPACLFAQTDANKLLEKAKAEMKRTDAPPDYITAGKWLEDVVKILPNNAEAWYYYGCVIDRYNHSDGEAILNSNEGLTENTSLAFENCLQITNDKYTGDILVLDPHTKILAAWGAQALYYTYNNNRDSAEWCLKQALIRGGINRTVAVYFRQVMDECARGAYLFTTGDMYTYYMMYLQLVEHYRPDVTCVDLNLLNTQWYPLWLLQKGYVTYSNGLELAKIKTTHWDAKEDSIPNKNPVYPDSPIVWHLRPTQGNTLLRSDQLLLDILQQNAFIKPVFFSGDVPSNMQLYLDDYLLTRGLTDRLLPIEEAENEEELTLRLKRLPVLPPDGTYLNNKDNIQVLNNYRFAYTTVATIASDNGHTDVAKDLIETADRKYPENLLPFFADATKQWFVGLRKKAESGDKL